jgi:hypothetical protein
VHAATGSSASPWAADAPRLDSVRSIPRRLSSTRRPLPDFLLIGAQRSGTTTLYDLVCQHPQVRPARSKELHYFDLHHERGLSWYRSNFPLLPRSGVRTWVTGDSSPFYLFHPLVPDRAAAEVPRARLLAILRNPVERAYSHYQHERAKGREPLAFADALDAEAGRTSSGWRRAVLGLPPTDRTLRSFSYVARGRYADQLRRWLAHYQDEQLLVLRSEDLWADQRAVMAGVFAFLGLDPFDGLVERQLNERAYPPMDPAVRERLEGELAPANADLADLLGRPFGWS